MADLDMLSDSDTPDEAAPPATLECRTRRWARAGRSGFCQVDIELGQRVRKGEVLGEITSVLGLDASPVKSRASGVIIGRRINPIVYQGEALVHIAEVESG